MNLKFNIFLVFELYSLTFGCSLIKTQNNIEIFYIVNENYKTVSKFEFDNSELIYPIRKAYFKKSILDTFSVNEFSKSESGDWSIEYSYKYFNYKFYQLKYYIRYFDANCNDELITIIYDLILINNNLKVSNKTITGREDCIYSINYPKILNNQLNLLNHSYMIVETDPD